ncbi:hypothetical protein EUGRSUZ_C01019 [Eucalyptus grandis]|uniref:Uncharacterized protein n=2 Tax=Eucalyptus grandis TaxID=71139 RepID=A0A059CMR1_EUCGR|nr:hypothetical protein EUGRSUZ_C01019 [Eucalyptus grandis]
MKDSRCRAVRYTERGIKRKIRDRRTHELTQIDEKRRLSAMWRLWNLLCSLCLAAMWKAFDQTQGARIAVIAAAGGQGLFLERKF